MIINAQRGRNTLIDSTEKVIVRVQGKQWRIDAPSNGTAVWDGEHSRNLAYYGDNPISGKVWIGKTEHTIVIEPGGL